MSDLEHDLMRALNWASIDAKASTADFELAAELIKAPSLAGYSKPHTITTAEELDALPETSVVLDEMGTVALEIGRGLWTMGGDEYTTDELTADWLMLPATVLYTPEES